MTRTEHIEWCKDRALEYTDVGEPTEAFASVMSDLRKHPETNSHTAIELGMILMMGGHLSTTAQMRDFIKGLQ